MDQVVDAFIKVRGSDDLVMALYGRLQADQLAKSTAVPGHLPLRTWQELSAMAVAEGILSPTEARWLQAMEGEPSKRMDDGQQELVRA